MFSIYFYGRFQSNPKESHVMDVRKIFKYFIRTQDIELWYPNKDNFDLIGYFDLDFIGCKVN